MNFLALVNRTRSECGVSAIALTTLTGLAAEDARVKAWVAEAWHDIQLHKPDWNWMRKAFSFTTLVSTYNPTLTQTSTTDLADWKRDSFRCYTTATGFPDEMIMPFMEYDTFRNVYLFGAMRSQTPTRPAVFSIAPNKTLMLGPIPAAGYTVNGEYYRTLTDLTADADDPAAAGNDFDARWHMLIVYYAMKSYAAYEAAPEVQARADKEEKRLMQRLALDMLPTITFGPPLA